MKPGKKAAVAAIGALTLAGALGVFAAVKTITVKGSDTMVILAQRWAASYRGDHPEIAIEVSGGGSGIGISALINGSTDLCDASRPMSPGEREKLMQRYGAPVVEIPVARDGITLYVNEKNPVAALSLDQIRKIYQGEITNWKEVGGRNIDIVLFGRENSSGTYGYFKEDVLKNGEYSPLTKSLPGTAAIVEAVAYSAGGIGYGGVAFAKGVKALKVRRSDSTVAYEPTLATIRSGRYPISRYLYIYLRSEPTGDIKSYIDWILGPQGQAVVKEVGYIPVK